MDNKFLISVLVDALEFKAYNMMNSKEEKQVIDFCNHAISIIDRNLMENDMVYTDLPINVKKKYRYLLHLSMKA